MILNVMRGSTNKKRLDGEEDDYQQVNPNNISKNSPKSLFFMVNENPRKIKFEEK